MKKYKTSDELPESSDLLGLEDVALEYGKKYSSHEITMINLAREGLNIKVLDLFSSRVSLSKEKLAYLLGTSTRNLRRYSENLKLNASISEKLLLLADMYKNGISIFGTVKSFNSWLEEPNIQFGGEKPFNILNSFFGYRLISEELLKIEHGTFA